MKLRFSWFYGFYRQLDMVNSGPLRERGNAGVYKYRVLTEFTAKTADWDCLATATCVVHFVFGKTVKFMVLVVSLYGKSPS